MHRSQNRKTYLKNYWQSNKGKEIQKRYRQSKKGKAAQKRYALSKKGIINHRKTNSRQVNVYPERIKARNAVNNAVRKGQLPHYNTLKCHYCPNKAQQYHHWRGYALEYFLDVIPVCKKCHQKYERRIA